jgi:hypothetical protein
VEAVILCGVRGSGKTALYLDRWLETHVRVSQDLMGTRHREGVFFTTCLETRQDLVVDDTNATPQDRTRYAVPALEAGFRVVCCLLGDSAQDALVAPTVAEGFDEILRARPDPAGGWVIEPIAPPAVL